KLTSRTLSTVNVGNNGYPQIQQLAQIDRNRFGDVPFFRTDSWKRARCVDQRNYRHRKFLGEPHQAESFAIALGMGATEIAHHVFLGVAAFLLSNDDTALRIEHGKSAPHR